MCCRYTEKGDLEMLFYNLNAKLRSQSQPGFIPEEGKLIGDVNCRWIELEVPTLYRMSFCWGLGLFRIQNNEC